MRRHHRGRFGSGPERGFLEQAACVHHGRGHRMGCRPGACVCGPDRPGGEALDPPWRHEQRYLSDCLVFQSHIQVRRRHGHPVLDAPLVQRLHQLAQARVG
jgi:hypothetical protein